MNDLCRFASNTFNSSLAREDFKIFKNCSWTDNSSDFGFSHDKEVESAFQLLLYFMASVGNCLLLYVMYKDPLKRFRNATSYFIINLTLADLLSTVSGITESVVQLNPQDPKLGDAQEDQKFAACFHGIGIQCSLLMIMIFSLDRYLAIVHAYTYKNVVAVKYFVASVILLPWCFAIIMLPVMYFAQLAKDVHELLTRMLAGNFIALSCVTLMVHPYTHWVFKRRMKDLRKSNSCHKQLLEENLKIAKVLATTVLVVSVCLNIFIIPYFVAFCFHVAKCNTCFLSDIFLSFWQYYPLLSSIRIMINSVVYAWRLPLYRKSLKALLATHGIRNSYAPRNGRINNFHLDVYSKSSSKLCSSDYDTQTSSNNESQSTSVSNTESIQNSSIKNCLPLPMALYNSGCSQTET